jgi:uncharacterized membrane protein
MPLKRVCHIVVLVLIARPHLQNSLEDNLYSLSIATATSTRAQSIGTCLAGSRKIHVLRKVDNAMVSPKACRIAARNS